MMAIHLMLPPTNSRTRPSVEAARSAATAWATSSVVMMEDLRRDAIRDAIRDGTARAVAPRKLASVAAADIGGVSRPIEGSPTTRPGLKMDADPLCVGRDDGCVGEDLGGGDQPNRAATAAAASAS
mmetsp:Transcript_22678/g.59161  ORF Transcript_22678/g.59161 Transcript_22678/m.59161 type:complete len:126 (-) Transcript_22678:90-467(-)